ncbi:MAG: helix-turn-helix domain-containing protein [Paracoccaceae bacterium]
MSILGNRMKALRLEHRQSLSQVAEAVGVSKAHIWELEKDRTNNPSIGLVTRLADHFGVTVSYLAGEDIEAQDEDVQLQRMFRQAKDLDPQDRETLDALLKSFLERKRNLPG